ncbi:hypothetical protein E2C01_003042 [Portunus trituberculatus]|uniref:Uncharacterized protein n=1 Tax=Portunus trituberculatus TaxID=210409 RepID=A0A5B7CMY1_PORTR|nr:hypothetical protein [Portunus trituberculatus]
MVLKGLTATDYAFQLCSCYMSGSAREGFMVKLPRRWFQESYTSVTSLSSANQDSEMQPKKVKAGREGGSGGSEWREWKE